MSRDLRVVVRWADLLQPKTSVLVTEKDHCDASFILSYALAQHLQSQNECVACLVTLVQSAKHYQNIAMKLGVNLQQAEKEGRLQIIDGLNMIGNDLRRGTRNEPDTYHAFYNHRDGLKELFQQIKFAVEKVQTSNNRTSSRRCLLILDNVSFLLHTGLRVSDVFGFIEYCRHLVSSNGCMMALVYDDKPEVDDDFSAQLHRLLAHRSDAIFGLAGFRSGYCKDVNGELTVTVRKRHPAYSPLNCFQCWHFKLEDKKVLLFPPGMTSAVI